MIRISREQFNVLWEEIETGMHPKCPVCGQGYATEQMIRSSPGKRAISFSCEHIVTADMYE